MMRPDRFFLLLALVLAVPAAARDAAFVQPGGGMSSSNEAVIADPAQLDSGESFVAVQRQATIFFVNQSSAPVAVGELNLSNDSNIKAEITKNDCAELKILPARERCAVIIAITPGSAGPWSAQLLQNHDGAGRVARAEIIGQTLPTPGAREEDEIPGLAVSTKKVDPVDFGEVEVAYGKAVRTVLLVNDSPDLLTVKAIDLIAAEDGLARLEEGCAVDQQLTPGESCPITLVWEPGSRGRISTDLIVRHTGRLGFMVIPVRGETMGGEGAEGIERRRTNASNNDAAANGNNGNAAAPPSAADGDSGVGGTLDLPPLPLSDFGGGEYTDLSGLKLTGIAGSRAIIDDGGTIRVVAVGDRLGGGKVKEIRRDAVIIAVGDDTEELRMSEGIARSPLSAPTGDGSLVGGAP